MEPSELLTSAIKLSSDQHTRQVREVINSKCEKDLINVCGKLWSHMHEVASIVHWNDTSPLYMAACRNAHTCLAVNIDSLSPKCIMTLVNEFLLNATPSSASPTPNAQPSSLPPTPSMGYPVNNVTHDEEKLNLRHHWDDHRKNDSYSGDPPPPASQIIIINNSGVVVLPSTGNASLDHAIHQGLNRQNHDAPRIHPVIWVLMFPFFCVIFVVSVWRAIIFCSERRGYRPFVTSTSEYVPLSHQESLP